MTHAIRPSPRRLAACLVLTLLTLAGCASPVLKESNLLIEQGRWQEGLARLEQGMKDNPRDPELRIQYYRQRGNQLLRVLEEADALVMSGRADLAESIYREVLAIDATNARASAGLAAIEAAQRHARLIADAKTALAQDDTATAARHIKSVLTENPSHYEAKIIDRELREIEAYRSLTPPQMKSRLQNKVNLEFRDASLKLVLEALSRASGINFTFDREVRSDIKTTIVAREVLVEDAIDMVLAQGQLEKKVLSENSVLVYPGTALKLRENQELIMRAFHIGNADVKQTVNLLRTMIKTKDMFVDERMNMIVMRDTPDAIRLAEKLIGMHDLVDPEVVLEIEILEVSRSKVRDLGVTLPTEFTGPGGTLATIDNIKRATIGVNTGFALKLLRTDGDTKTLANPRVRVRNKEKARVHVGDRVPVISSTLVGSGSGAPVSSEQIQYLDVGIKVEAEPTVHPDSTVAVKINLDVSSLGAQTRTTLGTVAYEVGTRNVNTVLRLRDGETQALMGLIRDDEAQTRSGLPFVGEFPVLDTIFGNVKNENRSRELVLLITPRIIRGNAPPDATLAEFWSGTEARLRVKAPFAPSAQPEATAPDAAIDAATANAATRPSPTASVTPAVPAGPAPVPPTAAELAVPSSLILSWIRPEGVSADRDFTVTLNARGAGRIKGVSATLRYQPMQAELLAVEDGGYFKRGGAQGSTFTHRVEPGLGYIVATAGAAEDSSVPGGDGSLLTLRFKPINAGTKVRLEFLTVVATDASGRQIPITGIVPLEVAVP